jgi:hypothetical protein
MAATAGGAHIFARWLPEETSARNTLSGIVRQSRRAPLSIVSIITVDAARSLKLRPVTALMR